MKNHRYLAPYMKEFSREMRKNPTEAENRLWQELRNKKLGFGFRRQLVIDSKYVADFVCLEKRLIIECDGGQHSESFEDKERDFYLESQNFRILRFWNNEIMENLEGVVGKIQEVLNDSLDLTHPLTPSARKGESEENSTQKKFSNHRQISTNQKLNASLALDFFAGSGTTLAVAQKLGRKWLGVEMGEHFYNVIIPRLKKVIAGFQSGISKECNYKGGGAFRYYELESYEEALSHCEYVLKDSCHSEPALAGEESHKLGQHELYKGKDYAKAEAILDYRKSRKLIDKLSKGESVCLDMHTEYRQDLDIFQTIANLMGWKIKRLFLDSKGTESCEFDNGEIISLDSLDLAKYPKLKNLIWWE